MSTEGAEPTSEKPEKLKDGQMKGGHIKRLFWLAFKIVLGFAVLLHLYVLALRFVPVPGTVLMMQRSLSGETISRDWTKLSDISPHMVEAVMGGEDGRFCEHHGIDWQAIEEALEDNAEGGRRRGGSTITQQTAKNVFFWNGGGYVRKAGEAYFALLIDFVWGKTRVMEVYLNVAEWGDGIFGVEAAAQARFGKPASALTRREAALLASVLPSPNKWRLDPPTDFVAGRAGTLQQRMSVIRSSGYASCVKGMSAVKAIPPLKEEPAPQPDQTDKPAQGESDLGPSPQETKDDTMTPDAPNIEPKPDIPRPTDPSPDRNAPLEAPRPSTPSQPASPDEIPQKITPSETPSIPNETPTERPAVNPPVEIPNEITPSPTPNPDPQY